MDLKKRKFQSIQEVYDDKVYKFKILLPNGINIEMIKRNPVNILLLEAFLGEVKEKCLFIVRQTEDVKSRRKIFWDSKELFLEDANGNPIKGQICFDKFKPNKTHVLRLNDGAGYIPDTFENMWDLTPDTDLLTELPEDYTFETALADLIDNSLQAVWSNDRGETKLIQVDVNEDEVSVFDTGPGMDDSDANSIVKWGKMGASVHRSSKQLAIGGKPPYLVPFFGMFGYGGTVASMHLGRNAVVSAKTKESTKVYWLRLDREALLMRSGSDLNWKVAGGIRDPSDVERELSPHGSFTKIVMEPKLKNPDIYQLQCKLKDIYFPYIQCDEISKSGRTTTLVDFQINGTCLAEIEGGEVAVTNLHSCNGPDFILNLHFSIEEEKAASKFPSVKAVREGNARLKCVYFPIIEGKENIERILEKLNSDGVVIKEDYRTFSRISIRRLGRLLPEARWGLLPFMRPKQKKGAKLQELYCSRVKCFIDTDAGFDPIPSKTDLAPQHPFTKALKDLGGDTFQKDKEVKVQISRGGKELTLQQLERQYQDWILQMHNQYDDDCNFGNGEPVWLLNASNKEALGITSDVVRVYVAINQKGKSWNKGQKVKIIKGACAGCHKNNMFATLEYFLLEGVEGDAGGEARVICRPLGVKDEDGSVLTEGATATLELHRSISLPIIVFYSGKCIAVSDSDWNIQVDKLNLKVPSTIQVLGQKHCKELDIGEALLTDASVPAGSLPPAEVVAVLRSSNFAPSDTANDLDQKHILKGNYEMSLDVKFKAASGKCPKLDQIFLGTVSNTSRKGYQGLYIFSVGAIPNLFQKAGDYTFSFFLKSAADVHCEKIVRVKAASTINRWELLKDGLNMPLSVSAGSPFPLLPVACYDEYDNIIPFKSIPKIELLLMSDGVLLSQVKNVKVELSPDKLHMTLLVTRVAIDNLDKIHPSYDAMLTLSLPDMPAILNIPCRVFPGPPRTIYFHMSESSKSLLPDQVVDDMKLEVFDRHHNHVQQGIEIELKVHGFSLLDQIGLKHKVDDNGFIDLSGLLKVTEGYGKPVSLSVFFDERVVGVRKFIVEKRELRLATMVPASCRAGSKLEDIVFEVVNSNGDVDTTINDSDKLGKSHMLRITSDFADLNDSIRYAFKQGQCVIPSITLPQKEGCFCIRAVHSQHSELHMKFQISVSRSCTEPDTTVNLQASEHQSLNKNSAPNSVYNAAKCGRTRKESRWRDSEVTVALALEDCDVASPLQTQSLHGVSTPQSLDGNFIPASGKLSTSIELNLQQKQATLTQTPEKQFDPNYGIKNDLFNSPERMITSTYTCTREGAITLIGPGLFEDFQSTEKEIDHYGTLIKGVEDDLKLYVMRKNELDDQQSQLQASMELLPVSHSDCVFQKEVVQDKIEKKVDSAASMYGIASKNASLKDQHPEFMADVVGLVALLATASTPELSCSLAEYLGEDQMRAIVCKSNVALTTPDKYEYVFKSLADELGRCIKHRQLIICLEDLRPYVRGILESDPRRRLALPNPTLPDGTSPRGFLGYAVNLIDIDVENLEMKTVAGHGLRETLFYRLFGKLQVYETKEDMIHARACITDGAVSLDGGIIRGQGIISLVSEKISVHFPIVVPDCQLVVSLDRREIMKAIEKNSSELVILKEVIEEESEKRVEYLKVFEEKKARYLINLKMVEDKQAVQKHNLSQQSLNNSPMAPLQSPAQ